MFQHPYHRSPEKQKTRRVDMITRHRAMSENVSELTAALARVHGVRVTWKTYTFRGQDGEVQEDVYPVYELPVYSETAAPGKR